MDCIAQVVSCCVYYKPQEIIQHIIGNIQYVFDYCYTLCVHLILLKSSMALESYLRFA